MSGGFAKVFESILLSSIWTEPDHVLRLWITMLVRCDRTGFVEGAVPGLARLAAISMERCEEAIQRLESPDPHSKTPDNEGRRIERVPGGWRILNHALYREMQVDGRPTVQQPPGDSYVYYARDGESVKIGVSKNPWARVNEMQTARPGLAIVAVERGGRDLELLRHDQFAHLRLDTPDGHRRSREWFRWCPEIEAFVGTVATNPTTAVATVYASASDSESLGVGVQGKGDELRHYCTRLAVAANKGLGFAIPRIMASSASTLQVADILRAADVPVDFAEQAVFDAATRCRVKESVRAMGYFTRAVLEAWEKRGLAEQVKDSKLRAKGDRDKPPTRLGDVVERVVPIRFAPCPECGRNLDEGQWADHLKRKHDSDAPFPES